MNRPCCSVCWFLVLFNIYFCLLHAQENVTISTTAGVDVESSAITTDATVSSAILRRSESHSRNNNNSHTSIPKTENSGVNTQAQANSEVRQRMIVTPCTTPNNDTGFCMPLLKCPALSNESGNVAAQDFHRKSRCGPKNENQTNPNALVCCGKYGNYENHYKHSVSEDPLPKSCGRQIHVIRGRILGGKDTKLGEFPWMARLFHKHPATNAKTFGCGGSLISAKYVLTAGHCLESENIPLLGPIFEVQFGEHNTETTIDCNAKNTKCADKPQVIRVKKTIVYPDYRTSSINHHHDIGLIHLRKAVKFTDYVYPICLLKKVDFQPLEYWISGWGTTRDLQMSPVKLKLSLPLYPHSNCTEKYEEINVVINDKQICAGGKKNKDSCTGDSGGPLMVVNGTQWFAAGIVSYGRGCGNAGWPGVYTNVTSYVDWIESTIVKRAKSKKAPNPRR